MEHENKTEYIKTLKKKQLLAVKRVRQNNVSILCGAPGVGKTYTIRAVLELAEKEGWRTLMAAPTGKAAKRMEEMTKYPASTIHKMLGPIMVDGQFVFQANRKNPLFAQLIIIDELSMIDTWLMDCLLKAIDFTKTKLLLVGDPNQLPSIGCGAILRDIIDSGVIPTTTLTEIQRNAGDIVHACHKIKDGQMYHPSDKLDIEAGKNLRHIHNSPGNILLTLRSIVCQKCPELGYDPIWDVQVISPTNKKGNLSCEAINLMLQSELNEGRKIDGTIFRIGDKVIQTKNANMTGVKRAKEYIVNGDMGKIISTKKSSFVVNFLNPDREVLIPQKGPKNNLLLAYAITCHRAQGSEAPVIILPVTDAYGYFADRTWVYTAISRARDFCVTIGDIDKIKQSVGKIAALHRQTGLKDLLIDKQLAVLNI